MPTVFDVFASTEIVGRSEAGNNFGDTRSGGLAGPMGLLIIALLGIATVLLIRNMNARLRRLPDRFPDPDTEAKDDQPIVGEADASTSRPEASERGDGGPHVPDDLRFT